MTLLSIVTTLLSILYFFTSAAQTHSYRRARSVGEASYYPLLAVYINTVLWLKYGILLEDSTLTLVNGIGMLLSIYTCIFYYVYSADRIAVEQKTLPVLVAICLVMFAVKINYISAAMIGQIAMCASVVMFGSPLISLLHIVRKRDASVLSLPLIMITLMVSLAWSAYGISMENRNIFIPNALGCVLGSVQLILWLTYRGKADAMAISTAHHHQIIQQQPKDVYPN